MSEAEKQILKNQMLIMDMLAYIIDESQDMSLTDKPYKARYYANENINASDRAIKKERR